jgi:hypothetical protein
MGNGRMIIMKEVADLWGMMLIGRNTRDSFAAVKCKDLDKCGFMMVNALKDNFAMMFLRVKVVCLPAMGIFRLAFGRKAILYHNFDLYLVNNYVKWLF